MSADDDLRETLTLALMNRWACERDYDASVNALWCTNHHCGWLHDVDACAHADGAVDALLPVVRTKLTEARADERKKMTDYLSAPDRCPDGSGCACCNFVARFSEDD